jgi:peptidoglycan/LPS O-acetylase OafA/YrhL
MAQPRVVQVQALTGIRIIAAVAVVVGHFSVIMYGLFPGTVLIDKIVQGGFLGVELFFILSGFIISHNYAERFRTLTIRAYGRFLRNRLARLYPVHLVTLAAVVALVFAASMAGVSLNSDGKYDLVGLAMNFTLMQSIPPATPWNGPAWSISAEMGAYIAFPVVALALSRISGWRIAAGAAMASLACTVVGLYFVASMGDFSGISYPSIWLRISGEFVAGCFLWKIWTLTDAGGRVYDFLALLGVGGIAAILATVPTNTVHTFLALPFVALIVFSCAAATGPLKKVLSMRLMEYGGRISYSLYMVHVIVLMIGGKILPWEKFIDSHWIIKLAVLIGYFTASFVGAGLLYRFVEEPWRKRIAGIGRVDTPVAPDTESAVPRVSHPS